MVRSIRGVMAQRFRPWIGFFCTLMLLASCQSVDLSSPKFACTQLDWFELGRSDGLQGVDSMAYQEKQKSCQGFSETQHEMYVNGWYSGVNEFCTSTQGFAFGRSGQTYLDICPATKETSFLSGYEKGKRVFLYEKDNQKISEELQQVSEAVAKTQEPGASDLIKKMTDLETRLELNKALIAEIQDQVDVNGSQSATF